MEIQAILKEKNFVGKIIYNANSYWYAASKRYDLIIEKDGKVYIDMHNLTGSGAKALFYRWVAKQK